jgi:putative endonuclease
MNELPSNLLTSSTQNSHGRKETGDLGERLAEKFLITKGYSTLARNYRIPGGEIDIVAKKGAIIVFVEVKTRRGSNFGEAFEAIDRRKKQKLLRAIRHYLEENGRRPWRCDLIAIDLLAAQIRHFKNIFLI